MTPRLPLLSFAVFLLFGSATAQVMGGRGATLGGPIGGGNSAARWARPIVLSGHVRTASGEAPLEPVAVKLSCDVNSLTKAYTGKKGEFSFEVDDSTRFAVEDASVGSVGSVVPLSPRSFSGNRLHRTGEGMDLSQCLLSAESPGYRSTHIQLWRRSSFDRSEVGTLILTPIAGSQAALVSATTLAAPEAARDAFNKATKELSKGASARLPKVVARLEEALSEYPAYAAAWTILGETKQRLGDMEGATAAFKSAVEADPGYLRPYASLIRIRVEQQQWERAVVLTDAALNLDPANVALHWMRAISQFESGNDQAALKSLDRVERDQDDAERFPETHHIRGLIYSERGDFAQAAVELRLFLKAAPTAPAAEAVKKRLMQWEALGVV